jgi:hypothetical protein
MPKSDRTRVRHMLEAANQAIKSASERTRSDLDADLVWASGRQEGCARAGRVITQIRLGRGRTAVPMHFIGRRAG